MFPIVAGVGGAVSTLVVSNVVSSASELVLDYSIIMKNQFDENYMIKRLSLELSKNYTTGLKDVNGSVIPQNLGVERLQQIERLIEVMLNQPKFK